MNHQTIAVISDIHSNVHALEAVLSDIDSRGIDTIVNLGDALFGPIEPSKTAELLMQRPEMIHIMGNCDRYLLMDEMESATFKFVKPLLSKDIVEWIRSFKSSWVMEGLFFCHGTPFSDEAYLVEEINPNGVFERSVGAIMDELAPIAQQVILCGHTHLQKSLWLPNGKLIVNPGSVGLPAYFEELPYPHAMESKTPHAKYAIVRHRGPSWMVEHIQVPYHYEMAAERAEQNGRDDYAYAIRYGMANSL
ncbi:YfcE family phosphodiesterase [Paenibacillus selenitireducens]|uniref:YfcE family phosphodiesterase n=1 Tax=Paenibacillus selenitireducens TaxID=1324314 RepID=A0A1T2X5Q1_9BACL|nr:metallophosphoesterase family protein [Paenibacillus selenitireducens]OPA75180.1 YfcE family phosphodiesterase [Paenibacillus selenitireducens]